MRGGVSGVARANAGCASVLWNIFTSLALVTVNVLHASCHTPQPRVEVSTLHVGSGAYNPAFRRASMDFTLPETSTFCTRIRVVPPRHTQPSSLAHRLQRSKLHTPLSNRYMSDARSRECHAVSRLNLNDTHHSHVEPRPAVAPRTRV